MTRRELIDLIRSKAFCTEEGAERAVDALFETLTQNLQRDGAASLAGFGTFRRTARAARMGRNPRTGEALKIKASNSVTFKPAKALRAAMQGATVSQLKPRPKGKK
jgi:nucleoid DNA-binding protein